MLITDAQAVIGIKFGRYIQILFLFHLKFFDVPIVQHYQHHNRLSSLQETRDWIIGTVTALPCSAMVVTIPFASTLHYLSTLQLSLKATKIHQKEKNREKRYQWHDSFTPLGSETSSPRN